MKIFLAQQNYHIGNFESNTEKIICAIKEAKKLRLEKNSYYHSLLGYLYSETAVQKAISHYQQAIALTKSNAEKRTLSKAITSLERNTSSM